MKSCQTENPQFLVRVSETLEVIQKQIEKCCYKYDLLITAVPQEREKGELLLVNLSVRKFLEMMRWGFPEIFTIVVYKKKRKRWNFGGFTESLTFGKEEVKE